MEKLDDLVTRYPKLSTCKVDINAAYLSIKQSFEEGGKLLLCGNGGSAADCEHIVGELMKGFLKKRKPCETWEERFLKVSPEHTTYFMQSLQGALPAISLVSQTSLMTAYSNDVSADMNFAQQVFGYGKKEDCMLGISTSGNSRNVIYAMEVAKAMGLRTIALTGVSGGTLKNICDISICVPEERTVEIQEYHLPIYHTICMMLEDDFFTEAKRDKEDD